VTPLRRAATAILLLARAALAARRGA
jgi:hypothetical protein